MLTARQNFIEAITGGNPDRFVNQYEALGLIVANPIGASGGYPSFASAAAIVLFAIVLTITVINLLVSRKHVHYA